MAAAECWFLDVGQGTSNVILLGERRGIVIDCGRSARVPLHLLRRYVRRLAANPGPSGGGHPGERPCRSSPRRPRFIPAHPWRGPRGLSEASRRGTALAVHPGRDVLARGCVRRDQQRLRTPAAGEHFGHATGGYGRDVYPDHPRLSRRPGKAAPGGDPACRSIPIAHHPGHDARRPQPQPGMRRYRDRGDRV